MSVDSPYPTGNTIYEAVLRIAGKFYFVVFEILQYSVLQTSPLTVTPLEHGKSVTVQYSDTSQ